MAIKVLLMNFPAEEIRGPPPGMNMDQWTIHHQPTLHDYHVIILDTGEFTEKRWFPETYEHISEARAVTDTLKTLGSKVGEQIRTGGVVFAFTGGRESRIHSLKSRHHPTESQSIAPYSYDWCPIELKVVSEQGDTFYPRFEKLKEYAPIFKGLKEGDAFWSCYFPQLPEGSRVLASNRAGYCVSAEIPIGQGKLVLLPRFKLRPQAVNTIVKEIVPAMFGEDEPTGLPEWLTDYVTPAEKEARSRIKELELAKRLLYTKDKPLKKAVAAAFEKIGFEVSILPDGALPDLEVKEDELKAKVMVKGHDDETTKREEVLQLLGHMSEEAADRGVFVSNHEARIHPDKRSPEAYSQGAIEIGSRNEFCLLGSIDLWNIVSRVIEGSVDQQELKRTRDKIVSHKGILHLP